MFRFKQFEIVDEHCAMKVGTDGVLIGAWADVVSSRRILDVGAGTALISLMVAQRSPEARVTAIEIDEVAIVDAQSNVANSPWSERIEVVCGDIRTYQTQRCFDHIVSNPPYFLNSLHSPDAARTTARHAATLAYDELIGAAERLLVEGGMLSVVLPTECAARFRREAYGRLWLARLEDVVTCEGEQPKRTLMEFRRVAKPLMPRCSTMTIYGRGGKYSDEYRLLTEEFYLGF